jgi:hypothetical protein
VQPRATRAEMASILIIHSERRITDLDAAPASISLKMRLLAQRSSHQLV